MKNDLYYLLSQEYIIRERPQAGPRTHAVMDELEATAGEGSGGAGGGGKSKSGKAGGGGLLGLPESEFELDNLTEFNTAHNRRITMLGINDNEPKRPRKVSCQNCQRFAYKLIDG